METLTVDTSGICENSGPAVYECASCNVDLMECECLWDTSVDKLDVWCHGCRDYHRDIDPYDLLDFERDDEWEDEESTESPLVVDIHAHDDKIRFYEKCRHYNQPVELGFGTVVYASSAHTRSVSDPAPDFGLYLDSTWRPSCLAYLIEWADYGIPKYMDKAAHAIIDAYNKSRDGLWVEIGCIGGHGRTGTALACMAVLDGLNPDEAIHHIRDTYCSSAIESFEQEWFIEWFAAFVNGGYCPAQPEWNKKKGAWEASGPGYEYSVPLDIDNFDPFVLKQGEPPEEIVELVMDRYFSVPVYDEKLKKVVRDYIYPTDENWETVSKDFAAQTALEAEQEAAMQELEPF